MDRILQEANISAHNIVTIWIQRVFREAAIQILRRLIVLERNERNVHVRITEEMLDVCDRTCRRLGNIWTTKLIQTDQREVAGWVEEVTEIGQFWDGDESNFREGGVNMTVKSSRTDETKTSRQPPCTMGETSKIVGTENSLAITKIRRIGNEGDITDWIKALDEMGVKGETMWPFDWSLIQEAAREIPRRLHLDGGKDRKPNIEYEVIPKSILKNRREIEESEDDKAAEIVARTSSHVTFHLEKKKRKAQEAVDERSTERYRREEESTEKARCPSTMDANSLWDWELTKATIEDKEKIASSFIHPDRKPASNQILLGAIKHLGRCHLFLQNEGDDHVSDEAKGKRAFRKAFKERLGPLQMIRDERDINKLLTKISRANHDRDQQIWFELDLGECMLEVETHGNKKIYAFSTIELSLKDEF
jgi:hypothetical protein